ncbi:DUF2213 domain-containing protein [Commensalibacter oyaizuii]|uniref:DUF2213 domain-containing protein n=1 Tax=Commensalibacter oyaizuii TaxID=3043873 RepID=A0ABT6Q3I6_9PROT|nr:DUF2213 domain-containing protein [Commensalibacter sp. TBRC 16381]MDI2091673.1 DUF2213 domain-containing protein [Commensalibacter sp. TBRC 16381]
MSRLLNRALVFDASSMRFEDWNGHLRVRNTNLTKANVCEYYGFEINNHKQYGLNPNKKYRFLRSPEALKKAVGSFKERPILYQHKAADATHLDNSKVIGTTGSDPVFSYPYIQSSITIWDGDYIRAIKDNTQAELSASYAFIPVMDKGIFDGEHYDGVMTEIYVDHVALVAEGRAGPDVRVSDERFKNRMPKLNKMGMQLSAALADHLGQSGMNHNDVEDAIATISGTRRKYIAKILQALLSRNLGAADCDCIKDTQIDETINRVMDEDFDGDYVGDEDPVNTIYSPDKEDVDVEDCGNEEQSLKGVKAFDAAFIERSIEKRIMAKAKQAHEARMLVKPLVGEWAITEDNGEAILRSVLIETTGKSPPSSMNYSGLKYAVDLAISQRSSLRVNDSKKTHQSDLQRFGATRLRSI